ncbi:hypothetical protein GCM10011499_04510 [Pelagibacterium lentulum]|uniref:Uncharacterized protein n=1 Tax=Pelagibacterium lentulum TaxID=2029865 RepID=A0A916VU75_9HYPH|nr:hypothetical protein GCM10011499_04510 [Pelagibacterium lentulum]
MTTSDIVDKRCRLTCRPCQRKLKALARGIDGKGDRACHARCDSLKSKTPQALRLGGVCNWREAIVGLCAQDQIC